MRCTPPDDFSIRIADATGGATSPPADRHPLARNYARRGRLSPPVTQP
jgi:hypothetical protein